MARTPGNKLKQEIAIAMQRHLPTFMRMEDVNTPPDSLLFRYDVNPDIAAFLLFYRVPNRNRFGVDAAWSCHDRFPSNLHQLAIARNYTFGISPDLPINGEFRFRVRDLWEQKRDASWRVGARDLSSVDEIVKVIAEHFMDYLNQIDPQRPGGFSVQSSSS